ncbi:HD-GYP domain-containing protein, partial [Geomonas sp.]|uniref:HD-GYP domain-containing protein n=1 Tax=Geomonas sp. TaxID=2651584 RepID=UPI002B49A61C
LGNLLNEHRALHLGVVDGTFFLGNRLLVAPTPAVAELAERLSKKEVYAITISAGVTPDEIFQFASLLARRDSNADLLPGEMERHGIQAIRLGIDQLTAGDDAEQRAGAASGMYLEAINAVRDTMREVEKGRIPSGDWIKSVANNMVSVTMEDNTTLLALSMIKNYDDYTFHHSVNVGILALALGSFCGLDRDALQKLNMAALLHDIGKTKIDRTILNSPGKLSDEEFREMKRHPEEGAKIVREMKEINPEVADVVLGHHIKYNRTGYPEWASTQSFSMLAEMVAVADCYDAITTLRAYQIPTSPKEAIDIIHRLSGSTLNSELVEKFTTMMGEYPVGSLVRLDNNEIALVVKPNPIESADPALKVVIDAQGEILKQPKLVSLASENGNCYASIIATVDPLLKNLDIASYLLAS